VEPLDPLDELLRGRPTEPRWERWRSLATERRPWLVAAAVIVLVSTVVFVVRTPSPAAVTLPRATGAPASGPATSTADR